MNYIANNFKLLRERLGLNQVQISVSLGFNRSTWNNYETGKSKPSIDDFIKISKYFGVSASDLLESDLSNVHLNEKKELKDKGQNVHLNVHPTVHLNKKKARNEPCQDCMVKDNFIAVNQQLLEAKKQIIDSQEARIKLLENKIEQMEYEIDERRQTQYSKKKEQKSA